MFAAQLGRPTATMKLADLQIAADTWLSAQSAAAAVRYLRPVLKWAVQRRYVPIELPTIAPPAIVARRDRVLSRAELEAVLPALSASGRPYAACMMLMLLPLARREEAASARWRDVNLDASTWTISETKNGQPHVVPLSDQAVALLRARLPVNKHEHPAKPAADALIFATSSGAQLGNFGRLSSCVRAGRLRGGAAAPADFGDDADPAAFDPRPDPAPQCGEPRSRA